MIGYSTSTEVANPDEISDTNTKEPLSRFSYLIASNLIHVGMSLEPSECTVRAKY